MANVLYTIWIRTGDQNLAGTDSNVYLQLIGTTFQTDFIHLPPQDIFAFESSSIDKFVLDVPDLGNITRCCVQHDNSEGDSGWYVVDARIQNQQTGQEWTFSFNQWLGIEESGILSACSDQ